jgi:hypothetical protein
MYNLTQIVVITVAGMAAVFGLTVLFFQFRVMNRLDEVDIIHAMLAELADRSEGNQAQLTGLQQLVTKLITEVRSPAKKRNEAERQHYQDQIEKLELQLSRVKTGYDFINDDPVLAQQIIERALYGDHEAPIEPCGETVAERVIKK